MGLDVLIVEDRSRAALAACRSLGERGLSVGILGEKGSLAATSKHCSSAIIRKELNGSELHQAVAATEPKLLLPVTDKALSICRDLPELLPYRQLETLPVIQDKSRLISMAKGVRTPKTASLGDAESWNFFPCIVKERDATGWGEGSKTKQGVIYCSSREELLALESEGSFIIQEQILGTGVGVFALCEEGEPLVLFAHERLLEKPPRGGVSVLSRSLPLKDAPVAEARQLFKQLNWSGVAMVEFKRSPDGFVLMEINPRLWGSLQLAISCGVDFPWLIWLWQQELLDSSEGRQALERARSYTTGLRLRWDLGTLDHLLIRVRAEGLSSLRRILSENQLLLFRERTTHETFSFDDPAPFGTEILNWLTNG